MTDLMDKGILIVDDDSSTREVLSMLLSQKGYSRLYEAENIAQCLSILSEHGEQIYVVLLDLMLPDGMGLSVMEHLINSHSYIVGIFVITGFGSAEHARNFFQLGTDTILAIDFQQKPLLGKGLLEQVNRTLTLIDNKRRQQSIYIQSEFWQKLSYIESAIGSLHDVREQLRSIEEKVERLQRSFLKDLGMDVLRLVIIGLAVLAFLYLDLGSVIVKILQRIR